MFMPVQTVHGVRKGLNGAGHTMWIIDLRRRGKRKCLSSTISFDTKRVLFGEYRLPLPWLPPDFNKFVQCSHNYREVREYLEKEHPDWLRLNCLISTS
jgi:hypothetical protein